MGCEHVIVLDKVSDMAYLVIRRSGARSRVGFFRL